MISCAAYFKSKCNENAIKCSCLFHPHLNLLCSALPSRTYLAEERASLIHDPGASIGVGREAFETHAQHEQLGREVLVALA